MPGKDDPPQGKTPVTAEKDGTRGGTSSSDPIKYTRRGDDDVGQEEVKALRRELKEAQASMREALLASMSDIIAPVKSSINELQGAVTRRLDKQEEHLRALTTRVNDLTDTRGEIAAQLEHNRTTVSQVAAQIVPLKQTLQQLQVHGGGDAGGGGRSAELIPEQSLLSPELWTRGALNSEHSVKELKRDLHEYFTRFIKQHPITSDGRVQKAVPAEYHHYERYRTVLYEAIDLLVIVAEGQDDDAYQRTVKNISKQIRLIFACCLKFIPEEEGGGLNAAKRYEQDLKECKLPQDIREVLQANRATYRTVQLHKGRDPGAAGNGEGGAGAGAPTPPPKVGGKKP